MTKSIFKYVIMFLVISSHCLVNSSFAKVNTYPGTTVSKTDTFIVHGNCGMCKSKIEGALNDIQGVKSAVWNRETKMMSVTYHPKKVSLSDLKKLVAEAGYDTDKIKAPDAKYDKLPGCCKYKRQ